MKFLVDENFPLALYHRLRSSGYEVEHIIALGQRGLPDSAIMERLAREDLVFLTSDREFMSAASGLRSAIIVSRVSQTFQLRAGLRYGLQHLKRFGNGDRQETSSSYLIPAKLCHGSRSAAARRPRLSTAIRASTRNPQV